MKPQDLADPRRRRLLYAGAGLFGLALPACRLLRGAPANGAPFSLGVASGEPDASGFVIWTRLAPQPLDGGGMPDDDVPVQWIVADDEQLTRVVRSGTEIAHAAWAHSVHVEVAGLQPDRWYWYGFRALNARSTVGRARTLPAAGAPMARLRVALASCQHYESGYYGAYRHMAEDDLDLVLHVGDYIYETSHFSGVRSHAAPEPMSLTQYRNRHALYKLDADLQRAHARFPWIVTWDDHDVQNDYAGDQSQFDDPPALFLLRRAAAYQAYWEHMPLRLAARPRGPDALMYRRFAIGDLIDLHVTDERQYRSDQPCGVPGLWGGWLADCPERTDASRTLFGAPQERWLFDGLASGRARWNVIAQQLLVAQFDESAGAGHKWWTDGWDGYPAARMRLLGHLHERGITNTVTLGGDAHCYFASDLKLDFDDPASPTVASDFTGTSITSDPGGSADYFGAMLHKSPHIKFFDSRYRGYAR
ncbi:MAG TPA: alkaline phosphatase D family protein, partial [Nevskiaceae bacterium]|nr:alkaline phosphatase D family protein [Nevskiaceae bacterium]